MLPDQGRGSRRTTRSREKPNSYRVEDTLSKEAQHPNPFGDDESEQDADLVEEEESDSSDEYLPSPKSRSNKQRGKKRQLDGSSEEEDEEGPFDDSASDNDELMQNAKSVKVAKTKKAMISAPFHKPLNQKSSKDFGIKRDTSLTASRTNESFDQISMTEENETVENAKKEADYLWKQVRNRNNGNSHNSSEESKTAGGLDGWLGIRPPEWPVTCEDAMINDRDSLFVGFVYSLSSSSQKEITHCLSHLIKVVHPQVIPSSRLPPALQHVAPHRRGATHDMYGWRCLALKRGRNGLGGPEDFGLEEGMEDDGERFGAKEIAKVIRMYGATDVLVVVSRWYGGTMLGPIRFRHIESCAKAALGEYMVKEALSDLVKELGELDQKIREARKERSDVQSKDPQKAHSYEGLDIERAQRLILARRKQLDVLKRSRPDLDVASNTSQLKEPHQETTSLKVARTAQPSTEDTEAIAIALQETVEDVQLVKEEDANGSSLQRNHDKQPNEKIKLEYKENEPFSSPTSPGPQRTTVKTEHINETDLTGWDEL